jgi:glycosyltransferase involved in cell wall biosynthesis
MSTEGDDSPEATTGVQVVKTGPFDRRPIRFSPQKLQELTERIAAADIMHLHTPWEPANIQLAKIARSCGTPYIISVHGMLDDWVMKTSTLKKNMYLMLGGKKLLNGASSVHCTAEAEAAQVQKRISKANISVVPLVFNPDGYLNPPPTSDPDKHWRGWEPPPPIVLFLSRIHPKKGADRLVKAMSIVCKTHDVKCIIAGSGDADYEIELREIVESLNLQQHVDFAGFVQGDRKTALYRIANMFALPTSQENFGLVFPEAMACSLPVITTRGVDIWPELEASGGALIISEKPEAIAAAIIKLLDDDLKRKEMGESARKWVVNSFTGDTVVNQYIDVYRRAMNE